MQVDIRTQGIHLTEDLREHAMRRLAFSLHWARFDASKVSMRLSDINGPRGGNDKRCQVRISLPRVKTVVIEDIDADIHIAIDRAIDRAGRSVTRYLERAHDYPHCHVNDAALCEDNVERDAVIAIGTD